VFLASATVLGTTHFAARSYPSGFAQSMSGNLSHLLAAEIAQFPAKAGVYVKHLKTGEDGGAHADDVFNR
jgi:hypothetical protein